MKLITKCLIILLILSFSKATRILEKTAVQSYLKSLKEKKVDSNANRTDKPKPTSKSIPKPGSQAKPEQSPAVSTAVSQISQSAEAKCAKRALKDVVNFFFGVVHGLAGFKAEQNVFAQCEDMYTRFEQFGEKIGISKTDRPVGLKLADLILKLDAVDDEFLSLARKTKKNSDEQKAYDKINNQIIASAESNTCPIEETYLVVGMEKIARLALDGISKLIKIKPSKKTRISRMSREDEEFFGEMWNTVTDFYGDVKDGVKDLLKVGANLFSNFSKSFVKLAVKGKNLLFPTLKFVYVEVCSMQKLLFMIVSIITSPGKVTVENITDLYKEAEKIVKKKANFFIDIFKWTDKQILMVLNDISGKKNLVISDLADLAIGFRKGVDETIADMIGVVARIATIIKEAIQKKVDDIKSFLKQIKDAIKAILLRVSFDIYETAKEMGMIDKILDTADFFVSNPVTKALGIPKTNINQVFNKVAVMFKDSIELIADILKCATGALKLSFNAIKNVISMVTNVITVYKLIAAAAASWGTLIPLVLLLVFDMGLAIVCNADDWEIVFNALSYAWKTKNMYSVGGAVGLSANTVLNPNSIALPLIDFQKKAAEAGFTYGKVILDSFFNQAKGTEAEFSDHLTKISDALSIIQRFTNIRKLRNSDK